MRIAESFLIAGLMTFLYVALFIEEGVSAYEQYYFLGMCIIFAGGLIGGR